MRWAEGQGHHQRGARLLDLRLHLRLRPVKKIRLPLFTTIPFGISMRGHILRLNRRKMLAGRNGRSSRWDWMIGLSAVVAVGLLEETPVVVMQGASLFASWLSVGFCLGLRPCRVYGRHHCRRRHRTKRNRTIDGYRELNKLSFFLLLF